MRSSNAPPPDRRARWSWRRVWVLCLKEWADAFHNRRVLFLTLFLPLLLLPLPLLGFWAVSVAPEADLLREAPPLAGSARLAGLGIREQLQAAFAVQFLTLFLLVPTSVPVTMATYSVVGEKRERTLEPLLVTPIHTGELLAGKAIGALVPGVAATVLGYAAYAAAARALIEDPRVYASVLGVLPLLVIGLVAPLLSLLGIALALVVSSRSTDPRAAEQVSLALILPVIGVFVAQIAGVWELTVPLVLGAAAALAALCALVLYGATRLFARGTILSRWG